MNRREVKKAPVLRFKGFTNDWEQRKFENLVSRLSKTSNNESLPNVTYDDIKSKENSLNKDITELTHGKKGIHFNKDDILFGKLRPYLGNILLARFNGIAVGDFWVLSPKDNNISSFLFDLIQTSKFKYISNLSSGSKMPRSDWNLVSKASFWVPIQQEQNKIGKIFQLIDNLVSLQQRKLKLLRTLKSGLSFKLFNKKHLNNLSQISLDQIGQTYSGLTGKSKKDFGHGHAFYVSYLNVNQNEIGNPKQIDRIEIDKKQNLVQKNDIFFTISSETPEEVGLTSLWPVSCKSLYLNSFCFGFRINTKMFIPLYLGYLFRSEYFREKETVKSFV
ncbi:restriction endonuclease subunit S [Lactobacillus amylovorus]|uniref:restriction endonuclease subunit S n=1 Tax=Lactobacillus amylovorus TaxID=1604 RepID=UPI003F8C8F45